MIPTGARPAGRRFGGGRLIIAAIVAIVSIMTYYSQRAPNPVTGEWRATAPSTFSGPRPPEFFSTHPNPERRVERIQAAIAETFPNGVPEELEG